MINQKNFNRTIITPSLFSILRCAFSKYKFKFSNKKQSINQLILLPSDTKTPAQRVPHLQLIQVLVEVGNLLLQTLTLANGSDGGCGHRVCLQRVPGEHLPVVKAALREGLPCGVCTQICREPKGLCDRDVRLDVVDRGPGTVLLTNHNPTTTVEYTVDPSHRSLNGLDIQQKHRLHQPRFPGQTTRIVHPAGRWDNLSPTTVNRIGVHRDILDIDPHSSHVLPAHHPLLGGPLPRGVTRVL
mmetsp:Transcript_34577/g.47247  ORF Transcript_34577/g.47247 Transcript_34577/m.47247 type:complete len:242 (+) Transcript_34577:198-923(+)